jgi:hypothetical protein
MKWLEIIELRTVDSNRELLESRLEEVIDEVKAEMKQQTIKTYAHAMINTDFSIHLFNESKMAEQFGSRLGLHLASALREFGLVNHSIWIEKQGK